MNQPSTTSLAPLLHSAVSNLPVLSNAWYSNQDIVLDGYKFIRCRFDNCRLHVSSANFIIENCLIDERTLLHFNANTHKLIQLFNTKHEIFRHQVPSNFMPVKDLNDGTITIK